MILVDTCIWSLALRRRRKDLAAAERRHVFFLSDLITAGDACLIGPIRQELLSGILTFAQFKAVREQIEPHIELPLTTPVWSTAAEYFNTCRSAGIAPDAIDMTICAAAIGYGAGIFTTDPDFSRYAKILPIRLFKS